MAADPAIPLRAWVFGGATAGVVADVPAVPARDRSDRDALDDADGHRGAGNGQPGHRRRRRLGCQSVARQRAGLSADRPTKAVQLIALRNNGRTCSPIRDTSDRYGVSDSTKCFTPRSAYFCRAAATSVAEPTSHVVPAPSPPYLLGAVYRQESSTSPRPARSLSRR